MKSMVATILREIEGGTLPTEIQKVISHNATKLEWKFQSLWHLVDFTTTNKASIFILMTCNSYL